MENMNNLRSRHELIDSIDHFMHKHSQTLLVAEFETLLQIRQMLASEEEDKARTPDQRVVWLGKLCRLIWLFLEGAIGDSIS